jgi:hypothetical protein
MSRDRISSVVSPIFKRERVMRFLANARALQKRKCLLA